MTPRCGSTGIQSRRYGTHTRAITVPEPITAWLVIERGEQIEERLITVDGSTVLELPLSADYAPNVFVTIVAIKPVDDSDRPWADMRLASPKFPFRRKGLRLNWHQSRSRCGLARR